MITHDHKLIFIHVPKCGGRSICEIFKQRFDHFTHIYYQTDYGHFYPDYQMFSIVRNPYDRYVSMYHYAKVHRRHITEPIGSEKSFKEWLIKNIKSFVGNFRLNSAQAEWGTDYMLGSPFWFSPQMRMLQDRNGSIDKVKIFKYEDGFDVVRNWMLERGVPVINIPHLNSSEHDHYLSYYDTELLRIVNSFIPLQNDCINLGYDLIKP